MPEVDGVRVPFVPAGGINELKRTTAKAGSGSSASSFSDIFAGELGRIKISGHAQSRMISRDISLSDSDMLRLENGLGKAQQKGATDSLFLMDDKAFIVNVPNRTVVTMFGKDNMQDDVITNIDSAVFV